MRRVVTDAVVILTGRDAAILWRAANLDECRIRARGRDDEAAYAILVDIYAAALKWRVSVDGKQAGKPTESEKHREWWTPTQIAESVGVTPRTVRNDIQAGRLPAKRQGRAWVISHAEAMTYLAARSAQ